MKRYASSSTQQQQQQQQQQQENKKMILNLILELVLVDGVDVLDLLEIASVRSGSQNHSDPATIVLPGARHHAT